VVLDACQSGAFSGVKGASAAGDFSISSVRDLHSSGVAVMASSTGSELSQESSELKSSYFTHHLLQRPEPTLDLPFLYRALTHRCLNLLRDEKNRARLLSRESPSLRGSSRISPDAQVLGLDVLCKLSAVIEETVMETLVYRFFDEMGLEEIAEVMKVSRKTVQKRLTRAAEALAALGNPEVLS
jgi:hypothetical protein